MAECDGVHAECLTGVPHGFLGRKGLCATGDSPDLNMGLGQGGNDRAAAANRQRMAELVLPGAHLATLTQIHSAEVVIVRELSDLSDQHKADALVSDRPGLLLGIVTADCAPVLLVDRAAGVVGAAHAGWRGAHGRVIENTVAAMEHLGARSSRISAGVGPCIAKESYEVDYRFRAKFLASDARFFSSGAPGHFQFDLESYVAGRLSAAGIDTITTLGLDTYSLEERYFSYRRAAHRGEPSYGRQISLIGTPQ